eukprot:CCRYP_009058-RA/>CCRYP_009058-RA protein AED:0.49 eAED:0.49 QI:33/1/1/1/0/0/2/70/32
MISMCGLIISISARSKQHMLELHSSAHSCTPR